MLINTSFKELVGLQKYSLGIYKTSFVRVEVKSVTFGGKHKTSHLDNLT